LTTVGEVGERPLIELMLRHFTPMPEMPVPFWDDVMAVGLGDGRVAVLNTDMLVWETDVPPGMTHFQAARKAVVMNFSDLAAKGVRPLAFLASLGLPRETAVEAVEDMARGFEAGAREHGGYVIGGDTNESAGIVISGVAIGVAEEEGILRRDGANPGDILATTGPFGDTAAAFKILLEGHEAPRELRDSLLESVYMPRARVEEGAALSGSGSVTSSIDSSDGLSISLYDLQRSSGVGFRLENLRVAPRAREFAGLHGLDPADLALYGGEEYELVFTVRPGGLDAARDALNTLGCELIELGKATSDDRIVLAEDSEERQIRRGGWEHFKTRN
jgi:thiamine-monophosphate kinase